MADEKKGSEKIKSLELSLDDKDIDLELFADDEFTAIRCEITSDCIMEPLDVAFVLASMAKSLCDDSGMPPHVLLGDLFLEHMAGSGEEATH